MILGVETLAASPNTGGPPVIVDTAVSPVNVSIGVIVSGEATYSIQHTFDDVELVGDGATWFTHPTLNNVTSSASGNYAYPIYALRVYFVSGSGEVAATFIQARVMYWSNVPDEQTPDWGPLVDGQTPDWVVVSDTQTPNWG